MYELTPVEQLPASAAAPDLGDALRSLGEAFEELGRRLAEALTAACREIAAKARARKKNYHRLMKELHRWLN